MGCSTIFMEHGIKTNIQQDIIWDKKLQQIGELTITTHGIKIMQKPTIKDWDKKELNLDGWIIIKWQQESRNIRKSYYLVSSHVNPLIVKLWGQSVSKEDIMIWPKGVIYRVKCISYDPRGGIYEVKCIWNDHKGDIYVAGYILK